MALEINYSFPAVPLSVTNPTVNRDNALDVQGPYSFLDFIKKVIVSYDAVLLQQYYNNYINLWYKLQVNKPIDQNLEIINRYKDFLRDISLSYTTNDEKKFLSRIDFDNPTDLAIALSFYSSKLKDIASYYRVKRDTAKYSTTKYKLKGSNYGTEKTISELVLTYLASKDNIVTYDFDAIREKIEVDIQELYDGNSDYFNQIPNAKVLGRNDLDYGENIFLLSDQEVVNNLFSGLSEELKALKEVTDLIDNKRELTKKYIGSSFYYLSSNSVGQYISGSLFTADNPPANFLNRLYPTTASVFGGILNTKEQIGFFKPSKTSIITVEAKDFNFSINNIGPNELIFFPDPTLYGNNNKAFIFNVDITKFKRGINTGLAKNQPNTSAGDTSFHGYVSEISPEDQLGSKLDYIYDEGYIDDSKRDVFNNIFGLIKDNNNFVPNIIVEQSPAVILNLQLNGYQFYDTLYGEGYSFDYSIADSTTYSETIRSGISSFTNSFLGFAPSAYNLIFRYFIPYEELITPTFTNEIDGAVGNRSVVGRDGGYFTYSNSTPLPDSISSDLSAFPGAGQYYFTSLYEGGIARAAAPIVRALRDTLYPTITADFTQSVRYNGSNNVVDVDGGLFIEDVNVNYLFDNQDTYYYTASAFTKTSYSTFDSVQDVYSNRKALSGKVYVKNKTTGVVSELTKALSYIASKYNNTVGDQLSSKVINFDLLYNTLFLQTSSYLVIDKYDYSNGIFVNPKSSNKVITYNTNFFNKISNRFKKDNLVYYFTTKLYIDALSATTSPIIYPEIYEYNYSTDTNTKLFPINDSQLLTYTDLFSISGGVVLYKEVATPQIVYNSRNNLFNCSWLLKDQNQSPYLFSYLFNYTGSDVTFLSGNGYVGNSNNITYILSSQTLSTQFQSILSSGPTTDLNGTLIL